MATEASTTVFNDGLVTLTAAMSMCICQTEPVTLADCNSLSGSGGKRVSLIHAVALNEIVISDGINIKSRKAVVPSKILQDTVQVSVAEVSADLWIVYFDGSEILLKSDQITAQELLLDGSIITPEIEFGYQQ